MCASFSLQFYLVMKGQGRNEDLSERSKNGPGKFVASKVRTAHASLASHASNMPVSGTCGAGTGAGTGAFAGGISSIALSENNRLTEREVQVGGRPTFKIYIISLCTL